MFGRMDVWQTLLLTGAAYVAVVSLVRLMRGARGVVTAEFREKAAAERARLRQMENESRRRNEGEAA